MRTIEVNLYKFNELYDTAKEKAREWYKSGLEVDFDHVIDDFETIGGMLGIEFGFTTVPLLAGGFRHKPKIFFTGFYSQGDGACFEGTYSYAEDACKNIREHAPQDEELHRIADKLNLIQGYYANKVRASITHHGRYYHEHSVEITTSIEDGLDLDDDGNQVETLLMDADSDSLIDCLRDLMRWLYKRLDTENTYQHSDEVVDESIIANEYEFTEDGNIA